MIVEMLCGICGVVWNVIRVLWDSVMSGVNLYLNVVCAWHGVMWNMGVMWNGVLICGGVIWHVLWCDVKRGVMSVYVKCGAM